MNDKTTKDWLQCNFSTTTSKEEAVSSFLMMAGFKNYFSYEIMFCCGIPQVTLLGERSDYVKIKEKINKIGTISDELLAKWVALLHPIIDQMIFAFDEPEHVSHNNFWNSILTSEPYGSGSRSCITGWLATLVPFEYDKNVTRFNPNKISLARIPCGFATAQLKLMIMGIYLK